MEPEGAGAGPLILVVEDNATNLVLVRALLGRAGYRLIEARSLFEARARLASARPDLVVLDLGLGDGDGLELLPQLRPEGIPAVAVSAFAMAGERERAMAAGCADYVTKPLDTRTFAARLGDVLARARRDTQGG